jgi:hypothetical protein
MRDKWPISVGRLQDMAHLGMNLRMRVGRFAFLIGIALACKSPPSSAKPPGGEGKSGPTPSAKGRVPATRLEESQIAAFLSRVPTPPGTQRKVVRDQAFRIDAGQGGERWFVPALEERGGKTVYAHYEGKPDGPPTRFEDDSWPVRTVEAVAFDDVDGDGRRDVSVLLQLARPTPHAGPAFRAARIFRQTSTGLELDWRLTDRANLGKPLGSMKDIRGRLGAKRDMLLPTPPTKAGLTGTWRYRYTGNVDDQMVSCHGLAAMARSTANPPCLVWTLLEAHCTGEVVADALHVQQDPEGPVWHERAEGAPGVGSKVCLSGKDWGVDEDALMGRSTCEARVTPPAGAGLPSQLTLSCTWQCREPSTCAGQGLYTFDRERPAP